MVKKTMRPKVRGYGVMESGNRHIYTTVSGSDKTNEGKQSREQGKKLRGGGVLGRVGRFLQKSNMIKDLE